MNHKKNIQFRYNQTVDVYYKRYIEIQYLKYQLIINSVNFRENSKLLDVGCGVGLFAQFIKEKAPSLGNRWDIYGIDFSIQSLMRYKESFNKNIKSQLMCGDVEHLPFKRESFDYIFAITVFQNLPNPKATLIQLRRLCKQDGLIILSFLKRIYQNARINRLLADIKPNIIEYIEAKDCEDAILIILND